MEEVNKPGIIYYGTKLEYLEQVLHGINKPIIRNESFISVSISGYTGLLPLTVHEDLLFLGNVYKNKYNAAYIDQDSYIHWKDGYINSLTCIDGFGPNDKAYYNVFGVKKKNTRKGENIALVMNRNTEIALPEKGFGFPHEYLSLALHSYIKKIEVKDISGIICDDNNKAIVENKLREMCLELKTWNVKEIST